MSPATYPVMSDIDITARLQ